MSYIDYLFKGIPIMIVYSYTVICGDLQNNIAVYLCTFYLTTQAVPILNKYLQLIDLFSNKK